MKKLNLSILLLMIILCYSSHAQVPTTMDDFFLPGSQPPDQSGDLSSPTSCNCHKFDTDVEPYFNWEGSMMAQAMRDPLFTATLNVANQDAAFSGDLCLRCHTPTGWLSGRSDPTDGSSLDDKQGDFTGVNCLFCHRMIQPANVGQNLYPDSVSYTEITYPADSTYLDFIFPHIPPTSANGMYIVSNEDRRRGPYDDANTVGAHNFYHSPFHVESNICGTCHDVSNPVFERDGIDRNAYAVGTIGDTAFSFNPYQQFPIERTYSEWLWSDYNMIGGISGTAFGGNKGIVSTCQDCHMMDITAKGASQGDLRSDIGWHDLTGGNTFIGEYLKSNYSNNVVTYAAIDSGMSRATRMLKLAATMNVLAVYDSVTVTIYNETGHKLPSGYPEGRRMWINLKAYEVIDGTATLIDESGAYDQATGILSYGAADPSTKVYEIKPGISADHATLINPYIDPDVEAGPSFHFVLNDTVYKDNRIPPRGFTNENFEQIQSAPAGYTYEDGQYWDVTGYKLTQMPDSVVVTLYYQTTSKEYIEFLRDHNDGLDSTGNYLYTYWRDNGKSTPVIMTRVILGSNDISLPVKLISFTGKYENSKVSLEWQTAAELENLGFLVLRAKENEGLFTEIASYKTNQDLVGLGNSSSGKIYHYVDEDSLQQGMTYIYKLQDISYNGVITEHTPIAIMISNIDDDLLNPKKFAIYQNYPNPFNPETIIPFYLPKKCLVKVYIYDVNGRLVKRFSPKIYRPGENQIKWDGKDNFGRNLASGIYYYSLYAADKNDVKKMVLIR